MLEPTDLDDRNNEELGWGRERRLIVNGILCKRRWALAVVEGEARPRCACTRGMWGRRCRLEWSSAPQSPGCKGCRKYEGEDGVGARGVGARHKPAPGLAQGTDEEIARSWARVEACYRESRRDGNGEANEQGTVPILTYASLKVWGARARGEEA